MPGTDGDRPGPDLRQAAVAFMTQRHYALQGARAATVGSESNGRATMFSVPSPVAWSPWD